MQFYSSFFLDLCKFVIFITKFCARSTKIPPAEVSDLIFECVLRSEQF